MAKTINWKLRYLNLESKYNLLQKSIIIKSDIIEDIIKAIGIKGDNEILRRNLRRMNNNELLIIKEKIEDK